MLTWAAERLLSGDAPVAGGAQRGGGHSQGGEQVTVAGAGLPLPGLSLPVLQPLLLLVLQSGAESRVKRQEAQTASWRCLFTLLLLPDKRCC